MVLIVTTIHKKEDAQKIGKGLLTHRLIVCYNLFPIESAFWWKGKIEEGNETMMIMKTKKENFGNVEEFIQKNSGYEVPEVIQINVSKVNKPYLLWLESEVK
ncbi:MAG TPA: divalent-cation tolerance protein CutA [Candidatus Limnocylindrales bacterium]|nr:divalent-cation tolerance protein CutA [Candidatus Limnocylindrales bacterium]